MSVREEANEIDRQASVWVARSDRGEMTAGDQAELDAWLSADSRRQGAFLRAQAAWSVLDRGQSLASGLPSIQPTTRRRRALIGGGLAAALAATIAGVALFLAPGERYKTELGEVRHVPLQDGSIASLNTESGLKVSIESALRRIEVTRGEVWFHVAKDANRPFVVEAGRVRVRAVGTAFSVRKRDDGAEVLVTEGVVSVWKEGELDRAVRLEAGSKAFMTDAVQNAEVSHLPAQNERRLAWRSGQIALEGETLADAAREFNRYNQRKIRVVDASLAAQPLIGLFRTGDPEGFARAAASMLEARVDLTESEILLSREAAR